MAQFSATVSFYGDNYCVQNHASCISAKYHRYRSQFNKVSAKTSAVGLSPFHDTVYVRSSALCAVETLDLIGLDDVIKVIYRSTHSADSTMRTPILFNKARTAASPYRQAASRLVWIFQGALQIDTPRRQ